MLHYYDIEHTMMLYGYVVVERVAELPTIR